MNILITGGNGFIATEIYNKLMDKYTVCNPSRRELDLLDKTSILKWFDNNIIYDLVIHTAIRGGSRLTPDSSGVFYDNIKMFFNLLEHKHKFVKLINFSSGAAYDRNNDINSKNEILMSNPDDYYGFSKNVIDRLILNIDNFYNIRIFNVFSENEKESRFIKTCVNNIKQGQNIIVNNDRYFDFFSINDLMLVIEYYLNNNNLEKDVDLCYKEKYKLSEIAEKINRNNKIKIIVNSVSDLNYIGNYAKLYKYNINFIGFACSKYIN
jgi:nucleoside-diphosphate-sugar epimerase